MVIVMVKIPDDEWKEIQQGVENLTTGEVIKKALCAFSSGFSSSDYSQIEVMVIAGGD